MPIYEYECQQCGKVFETIQKFSDPRLTECQCEEKAPVTKLISAAAFHLKGTGWYVTDFRDKGKKGGDRKEDARRRLRRRQGGRDRRGQGRGEGRRQVRRRAQEGVRRRLQAGRRRRLTKPLRASRRSHPRGRRSRSGALAPPHAV